MPEAASPFERSPIPVPESHRAPIGIIMTHHLPDVTDSPLSLEDNGGLAKMYEKHRSDGVTSERFDIRWNRVQPDRGSSADSDYLSRSKRIAELGTRAGLENIVVLSAAPAWALELAKTNPAEFRRVYEGYVDVVMASLAKDGGAPPTSIQVFNELNMSNYTPDALLTHIEECADIVRATAKKHFAKDIPLEATLQVSALPFKAVPGVVRGAIPFIEKHQALLSKFNKVKLDYYPGVWHQPLKTIREYIKNFDYYIKVLRYRNNPQKAATLSAPTEAFRRAFSNMDLLEKTLQATLPLQNRGVQIGIGEIGVPSIVPFETDTMKAEHQKLQTLGVGIVLWKLRGLIDKHNLTDVGIYSAIDEPVPEVGLFDWGTREASGKPKHIEGNLAKLIARVTKR